MKKITENINEIFPSQYIANTAPEDVEKDLQILQTMQNDFAIRVYCTQDSLNHFRIYSTKAYSLSQIIPVLENMGFKVINQETVKAQVEDKTIYMQDYALSNKKNECIISNDEHNSKLEEALRIILSREVVNDELNGLLNISNLDVFEINLLRAFTAYTQQIGTKYSLSAIRKIYVLNPEISELLVKSFVAKFNPELSREDSTEQFVALDQKITHKLKSVKSLDEEIVLRDSFALIKAMLRTNYFSQDRIEKGMAFKFDSKSVPNMPKPFPMFEIFVYHRDIQGVHLRGGKVARGGLRWSDRHADFRSEILGLVKAQVAKNSVIIPTGSKGGFVVRRSMEDLTAEQFQQAGIDCYKIFISNLLSITDNLVDGEVITPTNVVRHDDLDPYLVVAADKGTATFSDIANGLAIEHGFWLKDAFASGGANGYDHKKMGITAKGAWESVKRHFRHFDLDTQTENFDVVGIGGMAGDVFGNGMLLSEKINLVAAFNHRAIFVDPTPNVPVAYAERQRLFKEVQSWEFYNKDLISQGGGVFLRTEKSIAISPEMKAKFDIKEDELTPDELIVKLMKSPVDLIWNGGIGTFVKSSLEDNADVPDRANDTIRINGKDLRAKVIGEGGNLGFTQLGRIEFNQHGGKVYTDAIDNSAGVSCSDTEVNIKILLEAAINNGSLKAEDRDALLEQMTQAVEEKVLADNYYQGSLLDVEETLADKNVNYYKDLMNVLEDNGLLDRAVENLPTNAELDERVLHGKKVMTAPELSVLLAYAKIDLTNRLVESQLVKAPNAEKFLINYFPSELQTYETEIKNHKLRDDIIATGLANFIINKMGLPFIVKMQSQSVSNVEDIIRSFLIAERLFNLPQVYKAIDELDNKVNASKQVELIARLQTILENHCLWFVRNLQKPLHVIDCVELLTTVLSQAGFDLSVCLDDANYEAIDKQLDRLENLESVLDSAFMAHTLKVDFDIVSNLFDEVSTRMALKELIAGIKSIETENTWDEIASKEFIRELHTLKASLASQVLEEKADLSQYIMDKHIVLKHFRSKVRSLEEVDFNYAVVKVLVSRLRSLLS